MLLLEMRPEVPGCYCDPDYWLAGLLLGYNVHINAPPSRAAALPVLVGSPGCHNHNESMEDTRRGPLLEIQLNVPPAAAVAFLAGRANLHPPCPGTRLRNQNDSREQPIHGQVTPSMLNAWAHAGGTFTKLMPSSACQSSRLGALGIEHTAA